MDVIFISTGLCYRLDVWEYSQKWGPFLLWSCSTQSKPNPTTIWRWKGTRIIRGNLLPPSPVSDTHYFSLYIFHSQRLLFKRETSFHSSFSRFCGVFCVGVFPLVSKSIFSSSSHVGEVSYIHPFIFFVDFISSHSFVHYAHDCHISELVRNILESLSREHPWFWVQIGHVWYSPGFSSNSALDLPMDDHNSTTACSHIC